MWAANHEEAVLGNALAQLYSRTSTMREDCYEATDFVTNCPGKVKWGSRMRRIQSTRGRRDITIRTRSNRGGATEIDKLNQVQLYIYAWIDGQTIDQWIVFSVPPLLDAGVLDNAKRIRNKDGKTEFCFVHWERLQEIPDCLLGGCKWNGKPISYRLVPSNEWIKQRPKLFY